MELFCLVKNSSLLKLGSEKLKKKKKKQIFLGRNGVCEYLAKKFRKGKTISSGLRNTFNVKYDCF